MEQPKFEALTIEQRIAEAERDIQRKVTEQDNEQDPARKTQLQKEITAIRAELTTLLIEQQERANRLSQEELDKKYQAGLPQKTGAVDWSEQDPSGLKRGNQ